MKMSCNSGKTRATGFTLIELLVTVSILGILVGIAVPTYNSYSVRTKRATAMAALESMATSAAKFRANNGGTYCGVVVTGQSGGGCSATEVVIFTNRVPTDGQGTAYYTLTFENQTATTFTARATPVSTGTQKNDGDLTINQAGNKTWGAKNCWPQSNGC